MTKDKLGDWRRQLSAQEIKPEKEGEETIVMGWVEDVRDLGGIQFFMLNDKTGEIQITAPQSKVSDEIFEKISDLNKESVIGVKGEITQSDQAPKGVEIIPDEIRVLNEAKTPLPLDPTGRVDADMDTRLNSRLLDIRRPKPSSIFKIKHQTLQTIRNEFTKKGFTEVNTPKIVGTATETGAMLFPIQYFDREAFLSQSPQLYKEVMTGNLEKIFEIGPIFRAEEHSTSYHLNEVQSADIEMAFATKKDVMEILEETIEKIYENVKEKNADELEKLEKEIKVPELPLERLSYGDAIEMLQEHGEDIEWGEDFSIPEQRKLGDIMEDPYFLVDWPTEGKPFYIKPNEKDPEICHAFDLMANEIELASGGTRVHDKELLEERMRKQGLNPKQYEYHLQNFDWGMPPHAGFGLGVERLLMILTGADNIRECVLFPRDRKRLKP